VSRQKEVFSHKVLKCNVNFLEANVEDVRNLVRDIKTYKKKEREFQRLFLRLGEVFPNVTFDYFAQSMESKG